MIESPAEHHKAAERHAMAADNHERAAKFWEERGDRERAAKFWEERGDRERAALQRDMAEFERRGAALERRWARIVDPDGPMAARRTSELMLARTRESARALSEKLFLAAAARETSAELAEEHARRREAKGQSDGAAEELQIAERAREAARVARSEAEKWLQSSERLLESAGSEVIPASR